MRWILRLGYPAVPLCFVAHFVLSRYGNAASRHWEPLITFILSGVAVIPLAQLMGRATGQLAEQTGPTWGGLLNATFGNAAELIIAIIALAKGLNDIVKATLTGSIIGNLLLVSGAAMVFGGWHRERQNFSKASAQTNSALLAVALAAMLLPAIFDFTFARSDRNLIEHEQAMSVGTAIVLILIYGLGLLFTLRTHRHIFSPTPAQSPEDPSGVHEGWSVRKSVLALLLASVLVSLVAELLVGSVEAVATTMRWNELFVGCILLAIFGNAAEQSTAVLLARRNDMDTAMTITYQSSLQIALFTTPFMVLLSAALAWMGTGGKRLDLIFSPMEVAALLLSVGVVIVIGLNGETNWFEGAMLLAVYAILGVTFFYIPSDKPAGYDKQLSEQPVPRRPANVAAPPAMQGMSHVSAR